MKNSKASIWSIQKYILGVFCLVFLSGCMTVSYNYTKDQNYSGKITSVIIWDAGGLSERYSTLIDRMGNISSYLKKNFEGKGISSEIINTKEIELNKHSRLQDIVNKTKATHYIMLKVLQTSKRANSIAVEYYSYEVTLIDIKTKREVWRTIVSADFYSSSETMAKQIFERLDQDGLL